MREEIILKIEKEEWQKKLDESYKVVSKDAKVDGFRPGKAPRDMYEKKYGKADIINRALNTAIDNKYAEIIKEGKIKPIMQPEIEPIKIDEEGIEVKIIIITEPKITLGKYKDLGVKKETVKVTKKEIEENINHLKEDYAEIVSKDGEVKSGDIAVIDFEGFKDGVAFEGGKGTNYDLTIGSNSFIPGFEDAIIGMKKNEEKDIDLTFPEDYISEELKGQKVVFKVKVNDIKERKLPKLDKDFFEDLGMEKITTKEELEKEVEAEIKEQKEKEAENKYVDNLLEKAITNTKYEMDNAIIHNEAHHMYEELIERISMQGIDEVTYLKYTNTTKEDIIHKMEEEAEKRVKIRYLLREIIEVEKIKVTDKEIDKELKELAKQYNITEEQLIKEIGNKEILRYNIEFNKAIDILKQN